MQSDTSASGAQDTTDFSNAAFKYTKHLYHVLQPIDRLKHKNTVLNKKVRLNSTVA